MYTMKGEMFNIKDINMAKEMEIAYISWGMEESVTRQLNQWIHNGHDINKAFIKIAHTGDFYAIFYDAKLDKPAEHELLYNPETTSMTCNS